MPSVGLVGNEIENAPLVVLQRTKSSATAVYPLLILIAVGANPPVTTKFPGPKIVVPFTVFILLPATNTA